jgi:amino acid transporter
MAPVLNIVALCLFQGIVSFSRSDLRWDFLNMAGAITLLAVALAAIALFFFRRRTRDWTLIYIGVFCVLYAVRLLSHLDLFRALFQHSKDFWDSVDWMITCSIVLPFGLFLYQLADRCYANCSAGRLPSRRSLRFGEFSRSSFIPGSLLYFS